MSTNVLSVKDIKRDWHLINAKGKILGRLASEVASILTGKNKPMFVPYLDTGDNVVIINASKIVLTGKKETQKKYARHSGYPGGYKEEKFSELKERKPEEIIKHAVSGMVPKTKLGRQMIKKLHVFAGSEHSFKDKLKNEKTEARK